jgi:TnpA family transposase
MKTLLSILSLIVFCSFNKDNSKVREWTRYDLNFTDFKANADKKSIFDAQTECGIKYEMYVEDDSAYIRVVAILNRQKSWIKYKNLDVLKHEQGHFNICERSVRMFRQRVQNYQGQLTAKNIEAEMTKMLEEANESNRINQNMYETSVEDERVQKYWDNLLEEDINKLEAYSNSLIVIGLKE